MSFQKMLEDELKKSPAGKDVSKVQATRLHHLQRMASLNCHIQLGNKL